MLSSCYWLLDALTSTLESTRAHTSSLVLPSFPIANPLTAGKSASQASLQILDMLQDRPRLLLRVVETDRSSLPFLQTTGMVPVSLRGLHTSPSTYYIHLKLTAVNLIQTRIKAKGSLLGFCRKVHVQQPCSPPLKSFPRPAFLTPVSEVDLALFSFVPCQ